MSTKSFNAGDTNVIVAGRKMTGLAPDGFVEVERDEQAYTKQVGADGEVTRSKTNNKAGKIRITLQQSSEDNAFLMQLSNTDENTGQGIVPVAVVDKSGTYKAVSPNSWVQKKPVNAFGRDAGTRQWIFDCGEINETGGGN